MVGLSLLTSFISGALGGLFCSFVLGGPALLASFAPKRWNGALRLLVVCAIGALGGFFAGGLIQEVSAQAQGGGEQTAGAIICGLMGLCGLPFILYGLFHVLEYRLQQAESDGASFGQRMLGSAGCVIVAAPPLGVVLGGWLGYTLGSGNFALEYILVPFAGGVALLVIPLMVWLSFHTEELPQRGRMGRMELSGRTRLGWDAMQQRRAGARRRRW